MAEYVLFGLAIALFSSGKVGHSSTRTCKSCGDEYVVSPKWNLSRSHKLEIAHLRALIGSFVQYLKWIRNKKVEKEQNTKYEI
jgi:hypothetical protein